jgi:hypothetical protein
MKSFNYRALFSGKVAIDIFVGVLFFVTLWSSNAIGSILSIPMRSIYFLNAEYWVFLFGAGLLFIAGMVYNVNVGHKKEQGEIRSHWLALHLAVCLMAYWISPVFSSLLILYGSPFLFTWYLYRTFFSGTSITRSTCSDLRAGICIFLFFSGFYTGTGYFFTSQAGEHSGDEGHYIIQARSWWEDRDLDIRNQFENPDEIPRHGSLNSRHGAWYPKHSPGIAFVMAIFNPNNLFLRHLILGAVSALSLAGVFALARKLESDFSSSFLVVVLMGFGLFWGIYSSRALPETLGGALAVWGMYFCLHQKASPWVSTFAATVCISYLPWTQVRFIPVALVIFGSFGLQGLVDFGFRKTNLLRLTVFTLMTAALFGFYQYVQWYMYEGGQAYKSDGVLFSNLMGIPHTLLSARGILYTFPVFASALWAVIHLAKDRSQWLVTFYAVLLLLSVLLTASATRFWTGGTSVPGRFLAVLVPVLMSILARALTDSNSLFRRITLYLGTLMWIPFVALFSVLNEVGRFFSDPFFLQEFHGLLVQTPSFLYNPDLRFLPVSGLLLYAAVGQSLFVHKAKIIHFLPVVLLTILFHGSLLFPAHTRRDLREKNAITLRIHLGRSAVLVRRNPKIDERHLLMYSDLYATSVSRHLLSATTENLGTTVVDRMISVPHLMPNDWENRDISWATLVTPFPSSRGKLAIHYRGELSGDSGVELVIREGRHTKIMKHYEKGSVIDEIFTFDVNQRGFIYILVRFPGDHGELKSRELRISPYSERLLDRGDLVL